MARRIVMTEFCRIEEAGRDFDVDFCQRHTSQERFAAIWQMARQRMESRGPNGDQLRLK